MPAIRREDEIFELLEAYLPSAALAAALELQLFWRLAERPLPPERIAGELGIPERRCFYWLELLAGLGLLERKEGGYGLSAIGRQAILERFSAESWALLAQEARERYPAGEDLAVRLGHPASLWQLLGREKPDYVAQMQASPERAERFTRMLYELHQPMAVRLAEILDLSGVRRMMDLGGGSGVMALELLRAHPELLAVVVDIPNVCAAGRKIADQTPERERIYYHAADILQDELPGGFDLALECDVGIFDPALFRKVADSLNQGGRFVIVDDLPGKSASFSRVAHAFLRSLHDPQAALPSLAEVEAALLSNGFAGISTRQLSEGRLIVEARRSR